MTRWMYKNDEGLWLIYCEGDMVACAMNEATANYIAKSMGWVEAQCVAKIAANTKPVTLQ